jgi:phosphoribosylformylglycinamidine (FGAM) synthase-like amidotransferase family enzyme
VSNPKALVLSGDGINCETESQFALSQTGFDASLVHVSTLLEQPKMLDQYKMLVVPGGFAFGDEIASGKVLALKLEAKLNDLLKSFIEKDCLLLAICNGFQVIVQLGLLPEPAKNGKRIASLAHNVPNRFVNRWISMRVNEKADSWFLKGLTRVELPIRHGEGRLTVDPEQSEFVKSLGCLVYEENLTGSFEGIAGLTNKRGNVLGLMPHPEAYVRWTQHPNWTQSRESARVLKAKDSSQTAVLAPPRTLPDGLAIFQNARKALG